MLHQELRSDVLLGLLSRILESAVLLAQVDLFLQRLDSAGQPTGGHAHTRQAYLL
jgi:hypothetical protein